jgi:hypothetical protein
MRPVSFNAASPAGRGASPDGRASADSDEDLAATVSFTSSDDDMPDPPALQQLAQALLAWEPTLVVPYARLDHAPEELVPFAAFLASLKGEVAGQAALRGEIVGWLQALAADDAARRRAFRMVAGADAAGTALQTYRAIRTASQ